jgi:hypothetical protein
MAATAATSAVTPLRATRQKALLHPWQLLARAPQELASRDAGTYTPITPNSPTSAEEAVAKSSEASMAATASGYQS